MENSENGVDPFDLHRRKERYRKHQEAMKEMERGEIVKNAEAITRFIDHCAELGYQLTSDNLSYGLITGVTANFPDISSNSCIQN